MEVEAVFRIWVTDNNGGMYPGGGGGQGGGNGIHSLILSTTQQGDSYF